MKKNLIIVFEVFSLLFIVYLSSYGHTCRLPLVVVKTIEFAKINDQQQFTEKNQRCPRDSSSDGIQKNEWGHFDGTRPNGVCARSVFHSTVHSIYTYLPKSVYSVRTIRWQFQWNIKKTTTIIQVSHFNHFFSKWIGLDYMCHWNSSSVPKQKVAKLHAKNK